MLEEQIYNKRIVELMKKKTVLIETLNKLLELAQKSKGTPQKTTRMASPQEADAEADRKNQ